MTGQSDARRSLEASYNTMLYVADQLTDAGNHPQLVNMLNARISDFERNFSKKRTIQPKPTAVNGRVIECPIEGMVADALDAKGCQYLHESERGQEQRIDFWLPGAAVYIECKAFDAGRRVLRQLADKEAIILIQGRRAADWFRWALRND